MGKKNMKNHGICDMMEIYLDLWGFVMNENDGGLFLG
jgi:hypothetical protein